MKKFMTLFLFFFVTGSITVYAGGVKTIDKDTLKSLLGSPELVILDVRTGKDWSSSEFKIKGAIRFTDKNIDKAATEYPKDSTIVLYCA